MRNLLCFLPVLFIFYSCLPTENKTKENNEEKRPQLDTHSFDHLLEVAATYMETPYFDTICGLLNDTLLTGKYAEVLISDSSNAEKLLLKNYTPLIPFTDLEKESPQCFRERNIAEFYMESDSSFMIAGEIANIDQINEFVKEFIANPTYDKNLSGQKDIEIELLGTVKVSKGILMVKTKNSFNKGLSIKEWKLFFKIVGEFHKAYDELRNEYSLRYFGMPNNDLDFERKTAVARVFPINIAMELVESNTPVRPKELETLLPQVIEVLEIIEEE